MVSEAVRVHGSSEGTWKQSGYMEVVRVHGIRSSEGTWKQ